MKLVYPAIFSPCAEHSGYTVAVPDLPGCVTEGSSLADAILMAEDAASGWVLGELEDGAPIPAWLNTFAEKQHLSFSQVLTDALTAIYQSGVQAPGA